MNIKRGALLGFALGLSLGINEAYAYTGWYARIYVNFVNPSSVPLLFKTKLPPFVELTCPSSTSINVTHGGVGSDINDYTFSIPPNYKGVTINSSTSTADVCSFYFTSNRYAFAYPTLHPYKFLYPFTSLSVQAYERGIKAQAMNITGDDTSVGFSLKAYYEGSVVVTSNLSLFKNEVRDSVGVSTGYAMVNYNQSQGYTGTDMQCEPIYNSIVPSLKFAKGASNDNGATGTDPGSILGPGPSVSASSSAFPNPSSRGVVCGGKFKNGGFVALPNLTTLTFKPQGIAALNANTSYVEIVNQTGQQLYWGYTDNVPYYNGVLKFNTMDSNGPDAPPNSTSKNFYLPVSAGGTSYIKVHKTDSYTIGIQGSDSLFLLTKSQDKAGANDSRTVNTGNYFSSVTYFDMANADNKTTPYFGVSSSFMANQVPLRVCANVPTNKPGKTLDLIDGTTLLLTVYNPTKSSLPDNCNPVAINSFNDSGYHGGN